MRTIAWAFLAVLVRLPLNRLILNSSDFTVCCHFFSGPESACMGSVALARIISVSATETEPKWVHVSPQFTIQIMWSWLLRCRGGNITTFSLGLVPQPLIQSFSEVPPALKIVDARECLQLWFRYPLLLTSYIVSRHWEEPILCPCAPDSTSPQTWRRS